MCVCCFFLFCFCFCHLSPASKHFPPGRLLLTGSASGVSESPCSPFPSLGSAICSGPGRRRPFARAPLSANCPTGKAQDRRHLQVTRDEGRPRLTVMSQRHLRRPSARVRLSANLPDGKRKERRHLQRDQDEGRPRLTATRLVVLQRHLRRPSARVTLSANLERSARQDS